MNDTNTEMKRLLKLFRKTPVLSVQLIIDILKLNSPRKIISDLRAKGVPIKDLWVEHIDPYGKPKHYKEYWIEPSWFEGDDHDDVL